MGAEETSQEKTKLLATDVSCRPIVKPRLSLSLWVPGIQVETPSSVVLFTSFFVLATTLLYCDPLRLKYSTRAHVAVEHLLGTPLEKPTKNSDSSGGINRLRAARERARQAVQVHRTMLRPCRNEPLASTTATRTPTCSITPSMQ